MSVAESEVFQDRRRYAVAHEREIDPRAVGANTIVPRLARALAYRHRLAPLPLWAGTLGWPPVAADSLRVAYFVTAGRPLVDDLLRVAIHTRRRGLVPVDDGIER